MKDFHSDVKLALAVGDRVDLGTTHPQLCGGGPFCLSSDEWTMKVGWKLGESHHLEAGR